jgi:spermidine synthase
MLGAPRSAFLRGFAKLPARMRISTRLVALLLLGSGFSSVAYQTVWLRELRLIFGSTTGATAAVIGLFMAGLGFGSLFFGKRADRSPNGLRLYADLELGISLAAALSPWLITLAGWAYFSTGGSPSLGTSGATLVRLALAALCLGVPTFLMGGTLPAVARAVVTEDDVKRRSVATLYGANTLGAVLGVMVPTFLLLERFGNRLTLVIAVVLNLAIAIVARSWSRSAVVEPTAPPVSAEEESRALAPRGFVFGAAAVVGFVFLLMELVWYRMLAPILGGSTFTFGLILAMALLGIGAGGLLYGVAAGDRPASLRLFALTCAIEAVVIIVPFALGDGIAILASLLRQLSLFGFAGQVAGWAVICGIVVLPAGIVSGFQFPLLIALLGRGRTGVGTDAGYAYAWNTLGAIGGSIAGGFGLLPLLTAPGAWRAAAATMVMLSAVTIILSFSRKERLTLTAAALAIAATLLMILPQGPTAVWRHSPIGAGRVSLLGVSGAALKDSIHLKRRTTMWEAEGVESSIAMNRADGIGFIVNGKADGHAVADAGTQVMGGLAGAIMHRQPTSSLVIGLGTGSSAGWLSLVPTMERVDVAELEPAIRHVAEACRAVNAAALERPNLHLIYGDAREILLTRKDRYDIIFSEPSNPYRAGIASLFTQEFYAAAADRLLPGGYFLQWVQAYDITASTLATIYRTLTTVFPHVQTWRTSAGDLLLIASAEEPSIDSGTLRARIEQEPYRSALHATWLVNDFEGFLAHHIADSRFTRELLSTAWGDINTDDRNAIEFGFARSVGTSGIDMAALLHTSRSRGFDRPPVSGGEAVDWARVERQRATSAIIGTRATHSLEGSPAATSDDYGAEQVRGTALDGASVSELIAEGLKAAHSGDPVALTASERLEAVAPRDAAAIRAIHFEKAGRLVEAEQELTALLHDVRETPWITNAALKPALNVASRLGPRDPEAARRLHGLMREPFSVFTADEQRKHLLLQLAIWAEKGGCGPLTIEALEQYEPHIPWNREFLVQRARCYDVTKSSRSRKAKLDLDKFVSQTPERLTLPVTSSR